MNKKPRVGLGVIILNNKIEILLGKRIGSHGEATWAPPGGHLEYGESFEAAAMREVFEETGLKITTPAFFAMTNDFFAADDKHYVSVFMMVNYPSNQEITNCEPDKTEEWQWFHINNLPIGLFLPLKQLVAENGYGNNFSTLNNYIPTATMEK